MSPTLPSESMFTSEHQRVFEVDVEGTPTLFTLSDKDIALNDLIYTGRIPTMVNDPRENVRLGLMGFVLITLFCIISMIACCCVRVYLQWSQIKLDDGQLIDDEFVVRFEDNIDIEDPVPPYAGASYFTLTEWAVEAISNSLYTRQLTPATTQRCLMFRQSDINTPNQSYDIPPPPLYEEIVAELIAIDIE
ncbi:hypothetical protein K7432_001023 [Basidiobolus ranarum]|uniref:Uncharacterized protein n=1 Tax=Basidiobolus ranarum TaxID=34480 RepID=A0ABR2WA92_9FUNG